MIALVLIVVGLVIVDALLYFACKRLEEELDGKNKKGNQTRLDD